MKLISSWCVSFLCLFLTTNISPQINEFYIRLNQVGFLPEDMKSGVILSEEEIPFSKFTVIDQITNEKVFSGKIRKSEKNYSTFNYCYNFDFTKINNIGKYIINVGNESSFPFIISEDVYNPVVDSLMLFFRIQRCGPTHPLMHKKCHLSDATAIISSALDTSNSSVDVTGGWHDAGDYIKFFSTSALTTYMLLFAYEFDKEKFGFDNDNNNVPDILEEAKVGLDWLLRCNISDTLFVIQVQDVQDHAVGWRLPENDSLQFGRPAFTGLSKNLVGIYSAVMSLASRIWSEKFSSDEFANRCLTSAIQKYSIHQNINDIDSINSVFYNDKNYYGKLALGAIELYNATGIDNYLKDAVIYGDSAKPIFWWSWGDINSLAHYKLSKVIPRFTDYIKSNINFFNAKKDSSVFNEGVNYTWGTTTSLLGTSLQAILYESLTGSEQFDSLIILQRDYILGRNPWGLSFINGIGEKYPEHIHSQIAFFNYGNLPGALSAGGAPVSIINKYEIARSDSSFSFFNSQSVAYFDDWNDYITNEATIFGNATALFVYGYFSNRK
ncbi:MAG: glycoside hydrolase family 9 protein [Ignavibacteriaceae bacterium]